MSTALKETSAAAEHRGVPRLSVVVPAYNEVGALPGLLQEIEAACERLGIFEVIFVDDGSTDGSHELLRRVAEEKQHVAVVRLRRNFGKSAALAAGFAFSSGEVVVTLDADGQDDPEGIPALVNKLEEGYELVSGWRTRRRDRPTKRWASLVFNWVTSHVSALGLHDFNCGLKAYRGDCARSLDLYGELHRYTPLLADQQGWRVTELPVTHRERSHGDSKFGLERYLRAALDLLTVLFLSRYEQRPLHLFGGVGAAMMLAGGAIAAYLTVLRLGGDAIGGRPLLSLGVLLIVVGVQFLSLGLLGQMLVTVKRVRHPPAGAERVETVDGGGPTP